MENGDDTRSRIAALQEEVSTLAGVMEKLLPMVGMLNAHLRLTVEQNDIAEFRKRSDELVEKIDSLIAKFQEHWKEP